VDTPPKLYDGWQLNAVRLWDPPPPNPFIGGRQPLAPETGPPSTLLVDTPPKLYRITQLATLRLWDAPPPWPVTALDKLIQEFVAVVAANPPYGQAWLWAILNQWQIAYSTPQARNLSPGIPGQSVDQPPPQPLAFITQVKAWEPAIIVPQLRIYLPQPFVVIPDNPPWGFPPDWLYSVLTSAWKPGDPLPKVLQKILQEGAAPVIASGQREKRKWRRGSS
jgi:hypothetical protein